MDGGGETAALRRRRCCSKDDFLPEESFRSWGNYVNALRQTPSRFAERVFSRSDDGAELAARSRSNHEMKRTLSWWDLMWFGMGAVIGAGIFVLTGLEARQDAGPAVVLSYAISGLSALLSVFCYTEFAVEIPVAGGSFAYLRVELGDFVAFIAAGNILLEYVIGGAAVARSWTSYLASLCNKDPNFFLIKAHGLAEGYNKLDPIAVGVCIVICVVSILSTKGSSRLNYVASIVHILVILFIIVCGLIKSNPENYTPFAPFGPRGIFKASAVLFFAYVGFDAVSTMAEETKNPARDVPIGLVGSMAVTTAIYCMLAITLCMMQRHELRRLPQPQPEGAPARGPVAPEVPVVDITGDDPPSPPREPTPPADPVATPPGSPAASPSARSPRRKGSRRHRSGGGQSDAGRKKKKTAKVDSQDPTTSQPIRVGFRGPLGEMISKVRRCHAEADSTFEDVLGALAGQIKLGQEQVVASNRALAAKDEELQAKEQQLAQQAELLGQLEQKNRELVLVARQKDRALAAQEEELAGCRRELVRREEGFPAAAEEWAKAHPTEVARAMLGTPEETMAFFRAMYKEEQGTKMITAIGRYGYRCGQKTDRADTHALLLKRDPDFTPEGYGIDPVPAEVPQPPFPLD